MLVPPISPWLKLLKWLGPGVFGALFLRVYSLSSTPKYKEAYAPLCFGILTAIVWICALMSIRKQSYQTDPLTNAYREIQSLFGLLGVIAESLFVTAMRLVLLLLALVFVIWLVKAIWVRV